MNSTNISEKSLEVIKKMQQNELTESCIYEAIAKFAKGEENGEKYIKLDGLKYTEDN